jgi:hypothetical protein
LELPCCFTEYLRVSVCSHQVNDDFVTCSDLGAVTQDKILNGPAHGYGTRWVESNGFVHAPLQKYGVGFCTFS